MEYLFKKIFCKLNIYHNFFYYQRAFRTFSSYGFKIVYVDSRKCTVCGKVQRRDRTPLCNGSKINPNWITVNTSEL